MLKQTWRTITRLAGWYLIISPVIIALGAFFVSDEQRSQITLQNSPLFAALFWSLIVAGIIYVVNVSPRIALKLFLVCAVFYKAGDRAWSQHRFLTSVIWFILAAAATLITLAAVVVIAYCLFIIVAGVITQLVHII